MENIIAAIIGVIGTIIVALIAKLDFQSIFYKSHKIKGVWKGWHYKFDNLSIEGKEPDSKQTLKLKQRGAKVTGTLDIDYGKDFYSHSIKGKIIGDYLIYECKPTSHNRTQSSVAKLHIRRSAVKMQGIFITDGKVMKDGLDLTKIGLPENSKDPSWLVENPPMWLGYIAFEKIT